MQWYYPAGTPATPFHHHQHHQAVPFYGYVIYINSVPTFSLVYYSLLGWGVFYENGLCLTGLLLLSRYSPTCIATDVSYNQHVS